MFKLLKLTRSKYKILSQICGNLSLLPVGSMIIPVFQGNFDTTKLPVIILALAISISCILFATYFAEKGKL